jgi:hypothetical protein
MLILQGVSSMSNNKYKVLLSDSEKLKLKKIISKGVSSAKMIMHANVLLALNGSDGVRRSEHNIGRAI